MFCTVRIPSPMRRLTNGQATVHARGTTVSQVLEDLRGQYPDLATRLDEPVGEDEPRIHIYLNSRDIRQLAQADAELKEGDIITLLPALAGGLGSF